MSTLTKLKLSGFKSIREMELNLGAINVLIGANGAGKSNLLSVFSLLNHMLTESLQFWVGKQGGANTVLHYGAKRTPRVQIALEITTEKGINQYAMNLFHAAGDTLIFGDEEISFQRFDLPSPRALNLGAGHRETRLHDPEAQTDPMVKALYHFLDRYRVFQFHDTSASSRLRNNCEIHNNRWLLSDGGNLAAMLYKFQQIQPAYYQRIVKTIRLFMPFFQDFVLEPLAINPNQLQLRWRGRDAEYEFGPEQLSDGGLRAIALTTLLLQPREELPALIVLDEPELGLHPYAISVIGGLIQSASHHTQILLATQSPLFLDQFDPDEVIVVEQQQGSSTFSRLEPDQLTEWLEAYGLGMLWEKNIIGGRPTR